MSNPKDWKIAIRFDLNKFYIGTDWPEASLTTMTVKVTPFSVENSLADGIDHSATRNPPLLLCLLVTAISPRIRTSPRAFWLKVAFLWLRLHLWWSRYCSFNFNSVILLSLFVERSPCHANSKSQELVDQIINQSVGIIQLQRYILSSMESTM